MDTHALAAAFPFTSPDLACPLSNTSVLYGANVSSPSLVTWDRWTLDNHNAVILARSGAGKSYFAKLEALRSMYAGVDVAVIDPEDEYARLAEAVGGAHIALGTARRTAQPVRPALRRGRRRWTPSPAVHCSCTPSSPSCSATRSTLRTRAALDRAIFATYNAAGITEDPRTWSRPAPLLRDLAATLETSEDPEGQGARRASRTVRVRQLPRPVRRPDHDQARRPSRRLLAAGRPRRAEDRRHPADPGCRSGGRVSDPRDRRRRFVIVDEAWLLMRDGEGAKFLYRLAKSARKHWAGLTVVTQDAADVLASDLGRAVVSNSATQILLRQAPQAIDQVCEAFRLSDGERAFLLAADRGEALLSCGSQRVALRSLASPVEHDVCTTDPAELDADGAAI